MWHGHKISVILPTYNERDSIRECIEKFQQTGIVDEIIAVNNNAAEGTSEEVAKTDAIEVFEPAQGYGYSIRRGLREAKGDWLVVCEPDGTFEPRDLFKLIAYAHDFDYVIGTRTTRELVWEGANMGFLLKWGNWFVAKIAEFLFNCTILTDVGCTFRLIKRHVYDEVEPFFAIGGNKFGPHMTLLVISRGIPFVEIPVNYKPRVGQSAVTGSLFKAIILGFEMTAHILRYRFIPPRGVRLPRERRRARLGRPKKKEKE